MKAFIEKHKKGLSALVIAVGVAVTPVPTLIWNVGAPILIDVFADAMPE